MHAHVSVGGEQQRKEGLQAGAKKAYKKRKDEETPKGNEGEEELVIIPTTFKPRQESKFTLVVFADFPIQLREYTGPKPSALAFHGSSRG